jgi:RNA polymerase sigma-70 factor (ECF subfamily)
MEPAISTTAAAEGWVSLAERYRPAIFRYLLRIVGDRAQAEDLTQEALLRAHQRLADLKDPGALEGWIYRIATNVAYDALRRSRHEPASHFNLRATESEAQEQPLPDETRLQPDQLLDQASMSDCVGEFLAGLPDTERAVLLLHDLQGYSNPEIADQLKCSLPTVKIRLHRARTRLRDSLNDACEFSQDRRGVLVCDRKGRSCS